jgi:hypothetical protein
MELNSFMGKPRKKKPLSDIELVGARVRWQGNYSLCHPQHQHESQHERPRLWRKQWAIWMLLWISNVTTASLN